MVQAQETVQVARFVRLGVRGAKPGCCGLQSRGGVCGLGGLRLGVSCGTCQENVFN